MKLHLGNLPKTMTDPELKDLVTPFGDTASVELIKDHAGASKGFAFVEYPNDEHAKAAIKGLDGKVIGGQTLKVGEARPRKENAPRPGGR